MHVDLLPETLTLTLTLIVLVPVTRPRIAPNRHIRAYMCPCLVMPIDIQFYHICHALLQNIDVHVDPCSPKRETLTLTLILTLIVLVHVQLPRIAPNRHIRAHVPTSSDDNRNPILTYMPCASVCVDHYSPKP